MVNLQIAFPDEKGVLRFAIFSKGASKAVAGNPSAIQLVAKILLTDPGTDLFNPSSGGGLTRVLSRRVTDDNFSTLQAEMGMAIMRAEQEIRASQAGTSLPARERLKSIEVRRLVYGGGTWTIDLKLTMEDGNVKRALLQA